MENNNFLETNIKMCLYYQFATDYTSFAPLAAILYKIKGNKKQHSFFSFFHLSPMSLDLLFDVDNLLYDSFYSPFDHIFLFLFLHLRSSWVDMSRNILNY